MFQNNKFIKKKNLKNKKITNRVQMLTIIDIQINFSYY